MRTRPSISRHMPTLAANSASPTLAPAEKFLASLRVTGALKSLPPWSGAKWTISIRRGSGDGGGVGSHYRAGLAHRLETAADVALDVRRSITAAMIQSAAPRVSRWSSTSPVAISLALRLCMRAADSVSSSLRAAPAAPGPDSNPRQSLAVRTSQRLPPKARERLRPRP